jgi:cytochrome c oxidase subunit 2
MNGDVDAGLASNFRILEQSASSMAHRVDLLFTSMLLLTGIVALGVLAAIVFFSVRYRQGARVSRGNVQRKLGIEIAWTVIPLLLFIVIFAWAARDFIALYTPPQDALPVYVVAKQWMWKLQHRSGRREINELHVPLGQPVRLVMTSQDAIHSFYVPAFRLKQDVLPGRYTSLWFTPTQLGEFRLFCAEYCGSQHSQMIGRVVVMKPADYARWSSEGTTSPSLAQYGFARFRELGCSGCHAAGSSVHAPSLRGLLGREVHLQDGRTLIADENYIRDSILLPKKDVVAGFEPVMPSFAGQVSEEDIQALIAYIRAGAME